MHYMNSTTSADQMFPSKPTDEELQQLKEHQQLITQTHLAVLDRILELSNTARGPYPIIVQYDEPTLHVTVTWNTYDSEAELILRAIVHNDHILANTADDEFEMMAVECITETKNDDPCDIQTRTRSAHLYFHEDLPEYVRESDDDYIVVDVIIRDSMS